MTRERRLLLALGLNAVIVAAQALAGALAHSLGLLAEAGHNATDAAALVLSLAAVRLTRRPATPARSFGWHRSTILAAQVNAAAIIGVTALIGYGAVVRLLHPRSVQGGIMVGVSLGALVVNAAAAWALNEHPAPGRRTDLNMRTNVLHMAGDAGASAGVALAGLAILLTGARWIDPAVSLAVGALIAWEAARLVRESTDVLLESTPVDIDVALLARVAESVPGVEEIHDLHVWSLSSDVRALSAHLILDGHPTLEEAQATGLLVKQAIAASFGIGHATFELECEACVDPVDRPDPCAIDDRRVDPGGRGLSGPVPG